MAGPTLIPTGDFRSTYAQDTTIFPTTTSRNMAILGVALACLAPQLFSEYWLSILIQIDIFSRADWFSGGTVPASANPFSIFGYALRGDRQYFYVVLAYVVVSFVFVTNLMRTRDGRALVAVRDHYLSAEIMGINLTKYRTLSFGLAAFFAGVAGALYAH